MDYMGLAAAIASAIFWWKGAELESITPLYWAGPSIVISGVVIFVLQRSWGTVLLGQAIMLVAITLYRTVAANRKGED